MIKRAFDLIVVVLAAPAWVLVLMIVTLFVRRRLGSPAFFTQVRPGLHGRPFTLIKFRTLTNARDEHGVLLPDAQRMTDFGRLLRSTSLDELPELWNVLKGDMSLVGPRPLLLDYLPLYSEEQARRHTVCPGITGWAQINGRNALSWDEKLTLDVWYVDHRNIWLDLRIIGMTILTVFRSEGISQDGHATAEAFRGSTPTAAIAPRVAATDEAQDE